MFSTYTLSVACLSLSALFFAGTCARAEGIATIGTGALSCGKWSEARRTADTAQTTVIVQWSAGFLGGHNYYRSKTIKQSTVDDLETISLWHDTYCRNNPTHIIFSSSVALVEQLGGSKAQHQWKR